MDSYIVYLLKVSTCTMLFYTSYILLFSRDTFYLRNRFYLMGVLLLSILVPLLHLNNASGSFATPESSRILSEIITTGNLVEENVSNRITSFDFKVLFYVVYFSVSVFFLFRLIISVTKTLMIIRNATLLSGSFPRIIIAETDQSPFSFFPWIVIPEKIYECKDYSQILEHENAHVSQFHTFDLLFIELVFVFMWFNPFLWMIRRSILLNHEYLADSITIRNSFNIKDYQYKLLNLHTSLMNVPLAHNFSSLIKYRIEMINKKPTPKSAALKNIIILPLAAILFVIFSFKPGYDQVTGMNDQKSIFSKSSEAEILKFLATNTGYPQEARNSHDTATIFVAVKMKKGGIIDGCKTYTERNEINLPLLHEIVIIGYKPTSVQSSLQMDNDHPSLRKECLRVAGKLAEVKIPEWSEADMEFAVPMKFALK